MKQINIREFLTAFIGEYGSTYIPKAVSITWRNLYRQVLEADGIIGKNKNWRDE